jgi:hypothetical protein
LLQAPLTCSFCCSSKQQRLLLQLLHPIWLKLRQHKTLLLLLL